MNLEKALEKTYIVDIEETGTLVHTYLGMRPKKLWSFRKREGRQGLWQYWHNHVLDTMLQKHVISHIKYHAGKGNQVYLYKDPRLGPVVACSELKKLYKSKTSQTKADMVCSEDPPTDQP